MKKGKRSQIYDYSHISPQGYQIHVHQLAPIPGKNIIEVKVHHGAKQVGEFTGSLSNGALLIGNAEVDKEHQGQGLGKAGNLALLRHAQVMGANQVRGDGHTEDSARVYRSLSRTHQLGYNAPKTGRLYGSYSYSIKSEMQKSQEEIPMKKVCRCKAYVFPHRENGGRCAPNARYRKQQRDMEKTEQDLASLLQAAKLLLALKQLNKIESAHGALTSFDIHPRIRQEAMEYMSKAGIKNAPITTPPHIDVGHLTRISDHYEALKHDPNHPAIKASYDALKKETANQFNFLKSKGYKFTPIGSNHEGPGSQIELNPETSQFSHVNRELRNNKSAHIFVGGDLPSDHPLVAPTGDKDFPTYNDMFRAVHDVFGHAHIGVDFGSHGEDYAYHSHAKMFSPEALPALANETRGQNTNFHHGKNAEYNRANPDKAIFPDQKAGILPDWALK